MTEKAATIWTIGHSTRIIEDFFAILRAHGIELLVDVRHFPGSRRYPHFGKQQLADSLSKAGIEYHYIPELGGRRRPNRIRQTPHGAMKPLGAMPITWRVRPFPEE